MADADVINIPLRKDNLFLLHLNSVDRTAVFRFEPEPGDSVWLVIECHPDEGVLRIEQVKEVMGGSLISKPLDPETLSPQLEAQAQRIAKEQFRVWDGATLRDRLNLRFSWVNEELLYIENQFRRMLDRPYPSQVVRYNYEAFSETADTMTRVYGEMMGLVSALSCLDKIEEED